MINENNQKIPFIYNSDKPFHVKHLNETVNQIKQHIFDSKVYSNYLKYNYRDVNKSENKHSNPISDDWNFCILICKFIDSREPLSNVVFILERFLYNHRYQKKFDNDPKYLKLTINKVINLCLGDSIIGSLRSHTEVYNVIQEESKPNVKSINKSDIIKVCNLFSPFFLERTSPVRVNHSIIYENSTNLENILKVEMLGDLLNSFDLCVFLCVLKEYKKYYDNFTYDEISHMNLFKEDFYIFETKLSSLIKLFQFRNSGNISKKILASLGKLSKTHIEVYKNYKQQKYEKYLTDSSTADVSYSFNGNLLSFKTIRTKRCIYLKIYLSMPLFKIFQSDQYYALINWQSFSLLPNDHLRHLYFYFCLNVKVSRFYTEFTIDDLINKLFKSPPSNSVHNRKRRQLLRKLCHFFYENQGLFQDFDFRLSSKDSTTVINSIRVRRSKLHLT